MLTKRETATILAALLFWREEIVPHGRRIMRPYFRTVGVARVEPLTGAEIERLSRCLRASLTK